MADTGMTGTGMTGTVLILGASGLFGSRCAQAFAVAGWTVRRYQRGTDMNAAAIGADVIVNGLNPPMYHDWARLIPQLTEQVIAAAKASGATVIVPGNVYPFGDQPGPWGPDTAHRPVARKGHIRMAMEAAYRSADVQVILVRGGDFLDAAKPTTAMNMVSLKSAPKGKIALMGASDAPRAYAYLPDLARAAVELAAIRARLPRYTDVPFAGLTFSMDDLRRELQRQTCRKFHYTPFPWWFMRAAAPFWELARELIEMRYLMTTPHRLDPAPMASLLPQFETTPFTDVVSAHVVALGLGQRHINPDRVMT